MKTYLIVLLSCLSVSTNADHVEFMGVLRNAIPCSINNDSDLVIPFNEVNDKDLYKKKDIIQSFDVIISGCEHLPDFSYTMAFTGIENSSIRGAISIDSDDGTAGYAIKLNYDGNDILLNTEYPITFLNKRDLSTELTFKAFILGEEDAIKNRSIRLGGFTATTTFNIYYQ